MKVDPLDLDRLLRDEDGHPMLERASFRREAPLGLLAVFPGSQYGPDAPLLRGPMQALIERGWDAVVASYRAAGRGQGEDPILDRARDALERILSTRVYRRVGLLGKSMGTPFVAQLCVTMRRLADARAAYLTPLLGNPGFESVFVRTRQLAYIAIGNADPFYDSQALDRLRSAREFQLSVVEAADHGMNVPGDPAATSTAVGRVVDEVVNFITS